MKKHFRKNTSRPICSSSTRIEPILLLNISKYGIKCEYFQINMEVTALLVFVGGFAVCAAMVFLVSIFGVKEQTFEEALEMQRKKNEKPKAKTKEKKKDGSAKRKKNKRKNSENVASEGKYEEAVICDCQKLTLLAPLND